MQIGNISTKNNIFLAPMAGVTDYAYRQICEKYGAAVLFSEMVSAKGLYYGDKKTEELMKAKHNVPYGIQLFGSDPEIMNRAAEQAAEYCDFIDINMGCPAPKIVGNGDGCALMKNPKLAGEIVKAVVAAVSKPVTVKMRLGWDNKDGTCEFAKIIEANGASAITVHGRTRTQYYSGEADWEAIEKVVRSVNIPVIGNGDIKSISQAENVMRETGCRAVMIGRAAEGNPFVFSGKEPDVKERLSVALEHTRLIIKYKGESRGIKEARKHLAWYIKGLKGNNELKLKIFKATKYQEIETLINDFYNRVYK